jgi:N-acetyl sugar amidotransferase
MLQYCTRCVLPDSKPDLVLDDEGVCSACRYFELRADINWRQREQELLAIADRYQSKNEGGWDCIVPVSGGKDSTFQVVQLKRLGLNPLCVTASTCDLSDVGRANIQNIKSLGVDLIEFSPNPKVRSVLNRIGLREVGDIAWPEHVGIFTIPVRVAVAYRTPLIVWGENSQHEYGGPAAAADNQTLDRRWLEEFGGLLGLRVSDLIGMDGLRERDLVPYRYPTDEQLAAVGVTGIFLGYFVPWDGYTNALVAKAHGFRTLGYPVEGSLVDYENLDNLQHGVHDYLKFLKFGYGRASDQASVHIRRGRLARDLAIDLVREMEGKFPWSYLGVALEDVLSRIDVTVQDFMAICDRFTNQRLFKRDQNGSGELLRSGDGSLMKLNYDNT